SLSSRLSLRAEGRVEDSRGVRSNAESKQHPVAQRPASRNCCADYISSPPALSHRPCDAPLRFSPPPSPRQSSRDCLARWFRWVRYHESHARNDAAKPPVL